MPIRQSLARPSPGRALAGFVLAVMLAGPWDGWPARAQDGESGRRARVEALAARHDFSVVGLERVEAGRAVELSGDDPVENLELLLDGYNYLLVHGSDGGIRKLRILGAKPPAGRHASVRTERRGGHQLVETLLVGPNGVPRTVSLMIDTGASTIVLPSSMMAALGFTRDGLELGTASTANGPAPIRIGTLARARIGRAVVRDVAVGFIADDRIGDKRLLGMSFLKHFQVTIDDEANRLILLAR